MARTLQYVLATAFLLFEFANFTNHYNQGHFGNNMSLLLLVIFAVGFFLVMLYKSWRKSTKKHQN